jgi:hypothetical protein
LALAAKASASATSNSAQRSSGKPKVPADSAGIATLSAPA